MITQLFTGFEQLDIISNWYGRPSVIGDFYIIDKYAPRIGILRCYREYDSMTGIFRRPCGAFGERYLVGFSSPIKAWEFVQYIAKIDESINKNDFVVRCSRRLVGDVYEIKSFVRPPEAVWQAIIAKDLRDNPDYMGNFQHYADYQYWKDSLELFLDELGDDLIEAEFRRLVEARDLLADYNCQEHH